VYEINFTLLHSGTDGGLFQIGNTEILTQKDRRRFDPQFRAAKEKEIEEFARRGTWRVVWAEDLQDKANVMGGGFVLTINLKTISEDIFQARFVVQGHKHSQEFLLLHKAPTLHVISIRLLFCLASMF
jgi:hypothetical protein